MTLNAYLLDGVIESTTPPGETAARAQSRREAIMEMFQAFDPRDAMEAMIACHCVALQFLLNAAMRDAGNVNLEPAVLARTRAGAMAISKTLHQWVSKFEKIKQRNETRAAEGPHEARAKTDSDATPEPRPTAARPPAAQPPRVPLDQPRPEAGPGRLPMGADTVVPGGTFLNEDTVAVFPPPGNGSRVNTAPRLDAGPEKGRSLPVHSPGAAVVATVLA